MCINGDFDNPVTLTKREFYYKVVTRHPEKKVYRSHMAPAGRIAQKYSGNLNCPPEEAGQILPYHLRKKIKSPIEGVENPGMYCYLKKEDALLCTISRWGLHVLKVSCPKGTRAVFGKTISDKDAVCVDQLTPVEIVT